MPDHEPAADETAALRARISALSAASLRISASLDLEMVLNEVVESARDLPAFFGPVITGEQRQLKFVVRLRVLPGQREPALPTSAFRHPSQP